MFYIYINFAVFLPNFMLFLFSH